mmetsp:Transcript_735/g.1146  ORF Transcript_735/g.1146 Transcript_735/m.1146 type:complete len:583 (+) Transcript_735:125-1873(+)
MSVCDQTQETFILQIIPSTSTGSGSANENDGVETIWSVKDVSLLNSSNSSSILYGKEQLYSEVTNETICINPVECYEFFIAQLSTESKFHRYKLYHWDPQEEGPNDDNYFKVVHEHNDDTKAIDDTHHIGNCTAWSTAIPSQSPSQLSSHAPSQLPSYKPTRTQLLSQSPSRSLLSPSPSQLLSQVPSQVPSQSPLQVISPTTKPPAPARIPTPSLPKYTYQPTKVGSGDDRSNSNTMDQLGEILIRIIPIVLVLLFILRVLQRIKQRRARRQHRNHQQNPPPPHLHFMPDGDGMMMQQQLQQNNSSYGSNNSDDESQQNRRLRILTSVIHKKVLKKEDSSTKIKNIDEDGATIEIQIPDGKSISSQPSVLEISFVDHEMLSEDEDEYEGEDETFQEGQGEGGDEENRGERVEENGTGGGNEHFSDDEILSDDDENDNGVRNNNSTPSYLQQIEDDFYASSIVSMSTHRSEDQQNVGNENDNNSTNRRKKDIYVENMKSLDKAKAMNLTKASSTSSLYSPKSCPICMEPYREGDSLAWSKNADCPHAYHLDCIMDWLMHNDDCPMCRGDYLCLGNDYEEREL